MYQSITEQIKRYNRLWRETNTLYEAWAKRHGLSYYELLTMLSLAEADGTCTQKEISSQWQLPKQTVNTILKNFHSQNWVIFTPSEADRRNKQITLTEEGKINILQTAASLQKHEEAVWKQLGSTRAKAFLETTALYNKLFGEDHCHEHP